MPHAASADPIDCQRTINSAFARFVSTKTKILNKCKESAVKRGVPANPVDCPLTAQDDKINSAAAKMRARIAASCGGANKICNAADVGGNGDEPLAAIGWDIAVCPDLSGHGCTNAIASCDDVATCLICIGHEATNQPLELTYDLMTASEIGTGSAVNKCQGAIGKESAKVFVGDAKRVSACWGNVLKARDGFTVPPGCPATDAKAVEKSAAAEQRKIAKICAACGGGGDDDLDGFCDLPGQSLSPAAIGFEPDCPGKTVPGSASSCARVISTLDDLIACVDCITAFEVACATDLAVPMQTAYPAECMVVE